MIALEKKISVEKFRTIVFPKVQKSSKKINKSSKFLSLLSIFLEHTVVDCSPRWQSNFRKKFRSKILYYCFFQKFKKVQKKFKNAWFTELFPIRKSSKKFEKNSKKFKNLNFPTIVTYEIFFKELNQSSKQPTTVCSRVRSWPDNMLFVNL